MLLFNSSTRLSSKYARMGDYRKSVSILQSKGLVQLDSKMYVKLLSKYPLARSQVFNPSSNKANTKTVLNVSIISEFIRKLIPATGAGQDQLNPSFLKDAWDHSTSDTNKSSFINFANMVANGKILQMWDLFFLLLRMILRCATTVHRDTMRAVTVDHQKGVCTKDGEEIIISASQRAWAWITMNNNTAFLKLDCANFFNTVSHKNAKCSSTAHPCSLSSVIQSVCKPDTHVRT